MLGKNMYKRWAVSPYVDRRIYKCNKVFTTHITYMSSEGEINILLRPMTYVNKKQDFGYKL